MYVPVSKYRLSALWLTFLAVCLLAAATLAAVAWSAPAEQVPPVADFEHPEAGGGETVETAGRQILVKFEPTAAASERAELRASVEADFVRSYSLVPGLQLIELPDDADRQEAIRTLEAEPGVAYAEPDTVRQLQTTSPNDTFYRSPYFYLWGLNNTGQSFTVGSTNYTGTSDADIDAPEAWDLSRGSSGVTVAVIDSGMQLNHPDLAANLWTNPGETPGNGIDDDANGFIDDVNGWDFVNSDNNPTDDDGHGTHVAGTIGAVGNNNTGVTGVAWNVKLMPLKACNATGSCAISATIAALNYAVAEGMKISNNSYGGIGSQNTAERNAITAARDAGHLFVAAAGNDGLNTDLAGNAHYPSNYNLDNIVSVASTTLNDGIASNSNHGTTSVDLGAPGNQVVSTYPTSKAATGYAWLNGTSMASPHVAGAAALIAARKPGWTYLQVRSRLLDHTRPLAALTGKTVTGGMLNAFEALDFAPDAPSITSGPSDPDTDTSASFSFTGETVGAGVTFECRIDSGSWGICASPRSYSGLSQTEHSFEVRQTDSAGNVSDATSWSWTIEPEIPTPVITSGPSGLVNTDAAAFSFTGEVGADFECRVDSGAWGDCTSPVTYPDLSEGDHLFEVRQLGPGEATSDSASRAWTVDTVPPSAPVITDGPSGFVSSASAELSFTGEASATFECRIDSGSWESCSSPEGYASLTEGSHSFEVRQTDQAGNVSIEASRTWTVDTVAPSAPSITSGPSGSSGSAEATFAFTGEPDATFECRLDETAWTICISPKTFGSLEEGSHSFEVRQTDQAGNASLPANQTWDVVLTVAQPEITSGPEGSVNATSATFEFTGVEGATFKCRVDTGSLEVCVSPFEVTDLTAGPHEFAVEQTDAVGNTSLETVRSWAVLEVATVTPEIAEIDDSGAIIFDGAPEGFSYLCSVGTESLRPCTNPFLPVGLVDGTYPIEIVIEDPEGNMSTPVFTEISIEGAPAPPSSDVAAFINGGAAYSRNSQVGLTLDWPAGTRRMIISNSGAFESKSLPVGTSVDWLLSTGQGVRTVSIQFLGAGDTPLAVASDSIYLDPNRPNLKQTKVTRRKGKVWWIRVEARDSGSGLAKLAISTRKSKPGAGAKPTRIISFTKSSTVKAKLPARPRWAKVRDRAGNWAGWKAVRTR